MAKTTQDGRIISIATPLGKDYLLLSKFSASEGLSQLFTIEAELLHEEDEAVYTPTVVDPHSLLGQGVTISVRSGDGATREFSGMVSEFSQGMRDIRFTAYYITIVPHVWLLTQKSQSRIFQQMTVPDILKKVFESFEVKYEIQGTFEPRNYCVQYRETDFDFASRLMEEEGIYYYFEHTGGKHKMVVANTAQSHQDCPSKSQIKYHRIGEEDYFYGSISRFSDEHHIQTGKVTLWDYNFQLPANRLDLEKTSIHSYGDSQKLEMYDFPGGYARKYDGIDSGGGEQAGELQKVFPDREKTVKNMMEMFDSRVNTASGNSDCCAITAGYRFALSNHPNDSLNKQYVITSVTHEAEQNPSYVSNEGVTDPYTNNFACISFGSGAPPFRPSQKTPKPSIQSSQTAFVVGPAGEEIFTDKYGRVKVQFHWDREGQVDAKSSCWVRVAQPWAGNKWGTMFIPRIGMEVIVHFMEGDPDQPIITGCVYNPQAMPPYTLPDEKTKSTIKSNSSKGGGGFNEFRFEDKKGSEQIFIHAEKNQDIRVKNDCMETILHDRHLIVENDQLENIKKDKHGIVGGDHNEKVKGSASLDVSMDLQEKVGMNHALEAGMAVHIKAGMSAVIEAGTALTLKVGGSSININPGGIQIIGSPLLTLNSGGSPASGAGCSPDAPKEAKEADKADPGAEIPLKPPKPPPPPVSYSPMASAMQSAAQNGTPFVDI